MNDPKPTFSDAWIRWRRRVDLDRYDSRWQQLEAQGEAIHGEADFVDHYPGDVVLDGGCGTGRVAVELSRRGRTVTGVDNDPDMIDRARLKPEPVRWVLANLATVDLDSRFEVMVLAGNTLQYVVPALRPTVMANLARHLAPGGTLIMGSTMADGLTVDGIERFTAAADLAEVERFSTWERDPYDGGDYLVSVHRPAS